MWRNIFSCWWSPGGSGGSGNISKGVKDQGSLDIELYNLVNMTGTGSLVELMKSGKSNEEIDSEIRRIVSPFLYEGGKGKYVNITEIFKLRNSSKEMVVSSTQQRNKCCYKTLLMQSPGHETYSTKLVCWDLAKRGTVGETILHVCFLNSTQTHSNLVKRLVNVFPSLVADTYAGDMYFGETILHMAIAINEDPMMVKLLLEKGADVNQRCCGKFFCPEDQKNSRRDCMEHEWFDVPKETNYRGDMYLGEYPLSFAACLSLEECVRLLHAKGANIRNQDSNGNTVFHLMVIRNNKHMLDILLELEEDKTALLIPNRQNLTPLTLAAKLARRNMYEHILKIEQEHLWTYGDVTCSAYPLKHIDTISIDGEINPTSALRLIVYGDDEGHLDMMHGLVVKLLQEKWKTFVRFRFYRRFIIFILYFIASCTAFGLRPGTDRQPITKRTNITTNGVTEVINTTIIDPCYLLKVYSYRDAVRMTFECFLLIAAVVYTLLALKELLHQGCHIFFTTLSGAPAKFLFHLSCMCVILMLPGRAACAYQYEDIISVLVILCTAPYFLFFCRGFHIIGPFVVMIYKMIKGDLLRFFTIYAIFVVGFSQAIYLCFIQAPNELKSPFKDRGEVILAMFSMSVGEFEDFYGDFHVTPQSFLAKFVFVMYMILVTLLLVNMLIAMMGNTYQLINNIQKEWFRQWAKIVLVFEQSVTKPKRKEFQMRYSEPNRDNADERMFIIRWQLSAEEKEEQNRKKAEEWERHNLIILQKSPKKLRKKHVAGILNYKD